MTSYGGTYQGRLARVLVLASAIVLAASLVVTLSWAVATMVARPLDGVEGDILFEASRIRAKLALYIDPIQGAREYGPPPARFLVLYPPLWSALLSLVPRSAAPLVGRVLASTAWFGVIGFLVFRAPKQRRRIVAAAGAFVAGAWVLALYGANARPDAIAVLASGLALERVTRRSATRDCATIDAFSGVLFALAAWVKPNVLGAAPGVFVACLMAAKGPLRARIRAILPGLLGIACTSILVGAILHVTSNGLWLEHLLASTAQPPNRALWIEQMSHRGPFFLAPLAAALAVGLRARRDPGAALATGALLASVTWSLLSLAKIGSATNYFMEPCIAMLVVLSRADVPKAWVRGGAIAALALLQVTWVGLASATGASRALPAAFERARTLADVRHICGARPEAVVLADEPGLELVLNGRIIATPFQATHLARRGRFPIEKWVRDIESPHVDCLVMQDDLLERPMSDERVAHDRFSPELRRALAARFELVTMLAGYRIYRTADRTHSP